MAASAVTHFSDRLVSAIEATRAPACVGLDPVLERLPASVVESASSPPEALETFCLGVIEATQGIAAAIKPQSACFERYGGEGVSALQRVCDAARAEGFIVILDAKRGDIGVTTEHYAAFAFDERDGLGADAVTVNPYLGTEAIEPFLAERWASPRGRGVFVLVRTSNPGCDDVQCARLEQGGTIAGMIARQVAMLGRERLGEEGWSDVGAVVAATKPEDAAALRSMMPDQIFLVPGYGAQGGTVETARSLFADQPGRRGSGGLVTASRSVIYAFEQQRRDWIGAVRTAAARFAEEVGPLMASSSSGGV